MCRRERFEASHAAIQRRCSPSRHGAVTLHSGHADVRVRVHGVRGAFRGARPQRGPGRSVPDVRRREGAEAVLRVRGARYIVVAELLGRRRGRLLRRQLRLRPLAHGAQARRPSRIRGRTTLGAVLSKSPAVAGGLRLFAAAWPVRAVAPRGRVEAGVVAWAVTWCGAGKVSVGAARPGSPAGVTTWTWLAGFRHRPPVRAARVTSSETH